MRELSVLGDGLAGLLLGQALRRTGPVKVHGASTCNTPPQALAHLFAGRTFRRSALEVRAFERAVDFWRQEPLALELPVRRRVTVGDRLDRSTREHGVPERYAPKPVEGRPRDPNQVWLEYHPGFSIAARELAERLRAELGVEKVCIDRLCELPPPRVLALGAQAAQRFPEVAWDLSRGRTVCAFPEQPLEPAIVIGGGLHLAPTGKDSSVVLGGRFEALSGPCLDELEKARELTGVPHQEISVWSGERVAPALDRRPVLGWLDPETFLFLGFGSRGMFWLPYCVELAVEALRNPGTALPPELDWRRVQGFAGAGLPPLT